ncbi:MAG: hypothetical protein WCC27_07940 [Acidobacteriaceae bacterium]
MLETELWLSFVSLLRSYAAAANLNLEEHARIEHGETSAALIAGDTRLEMIFDPETGTVTWAMSAPPQPPITGSFAFLPEGTVNIDGTIKDLDHAAIDFVAVVANQRGKGIGR